MKIMKIRNMTITYKNRHFSGVTFNIQYYIDGVNEIISEKGVKLNHSDFQRLIDIDEFEIPADQRIETFQDAIEWYLSN